MIYLKIGFADKFEGLRKISAGNAFFDFNNNDGFFLNDLSLDFQI